MAGEITLKLLDTIPFFDSFRPPDRRTLIAVMERREFASGEWMVDQGTKDGGLFVLLSGTVRVERKLPDERTVGLSVLESGAIFGILSLLDGGVRAARCVAETEVVCAEISRSDVHSLIHGDSPLALHFQMEVLRVLFRDLRKTNKRLVDLMTLPEATLHLDAVEDWLGGLG